MSMPDELAILFDEHKCYESFDVCYESFDVCYESFDVMVEDFLKEVFLKKFSSK